MNLTNPGTNLYIMALDLRSADRARGNTHLIEFQNVKYLVKAGISILGYLRSMVSSTSQYRLATAVGRHQGAADLDHPALAGSELLAVFHGCAVWYVKTGKIPALGGLRQRRDMVLRCNPPAGAGSAREGF